MEVIPWSGAFSGGGVATRDDRSDRAHGCASPGRERSTPRYDRPNYYDIYLLRVRVVVFLSFSNKGSVCMSAQLLDGKALAATVKLEVAQQISELVSQGKDSPCLAVILVGQDSASEVYVRNKRQSCEAVGIRSVAYDLPEDTGEDKLLQLIDTLNADSAVHGILVQLPLPKHIHSHAVIERINPDKDVDGFHPYNLGRLAQNRPHLQPCTPFGIMTLLRRHDIHLKGINAVMVGASNIVGRPMALELLAAGATVTVCHRFTKNLHDHVSRAELLIVAIGKQHVIQSDWIRNGAVVVDVGIHRLADGSISGDIEFITAKERASWITPVPGGVGPMTVAMLMQNTLVAARIVYAHTSS